MIKQFKTQKFPKLALAITSALLLTQTTMAGDFDTLEQRAGYGVGYSYAQSLLQQGININEKSFMKGFSDAFAKKAAALKEEDIIKAIEELQTVTLAKRAEEEKKVADKNQKEGDAFLAENKTKDGVKTTASGLQYKVIKAGTGATPKLSDTVTTHYRGTLINGTEFDSSYKRNQPATFPVNGVIPGWTEALQLMKTGAKWQLFIPAKLAYGSNAPRGSAITPNSTLIFDIELIEVKAAK